MEEKYYNQSLGTYKRVETQSVAIGDRPLGGNFPIRHQSMTNTPTMDIDATVEQAIRIIDAGADYVRITAPGVKEAEALKGIKEALLARGYTNPLVADIHFNPRAAIVAAEHVEKVRINPGNYVDKKKFEHIEYTDAEYQEELQKIRQNLKPLIEACKKHQTAIRIGVNHGSLSDRIMSRYGDTPKGMVVSLLEFLDICIAEDFHNITLSIKASNTLVMVQACRMLVAEMKKNGAVYPLHLGVTEAGEGEDGRIKSAVGIGSLLADGIGDTVRVSLTEDPEAEIPVAKAIVDHCTASQKEDSFFEGEPLVDPFTYARRHTHAVAGCLGGDKKIAVVADMRTKTLVWESIVTVPEFVIVNRYDPKVPRSVAQIIPFVQWATKPNSYPLFSAKQFASATELPAKLNFVQLALGEIDSVAELLRDNATMVAVILQAGSVYQFRELRAAMFRLLQCGIATPVIISFSYGDADISALRLKAAADAGALLLDGLGDGLLVNADAVDRPNTVVSLAFSILQASRVRFTKTEYISCPSCGRTLFDLQKTAQEIRERTGHLSGLKIGIMGCIVNGPGEMADADYGYVGAGPQKVNLYKQKTVVRKNIPSSQAVDQLVEVIKEYGDWFDSSEENNQF